jgi:hypothetical protein
MDVLEDKVVIVRRLLWNDGTMVARFNFFITQIKKDVFVFGILWCLWFLI